MDLSIILTMWVKIVNFRLITIFESITVGNLRKLYILLIDKCDRISIIGITIVHSS